MKHHTWVLGSPTFLVLRELELTVRRKEVTETTEHILAGKKQFLNIPDW